uniref:Uncharacterized protein n=1 Tax=Glossina pallidipes TaxID=7398 RepID=A0A1A9Z731_GLOPL
MFISVFVLMDIQARKAGVVQVSPQNAKQNPVPMFITNCFQMLSNENTTSLELTSVNYFLADVMLRVRSVDSNLTTNLMSLYIENELIKAHANFYMNPYSKSIDFGLSKTTGRNNYKKQRTQSAL